MLEAHGSTEAEATDFLRQLSDKLIKDHSEHFTDADDLWEKRRGQLHKHLQIIDGVIDEQLKTLTKAPSDNDQIHALRLMQMGILTSNRAKADEDLHLLNISRSRFTQHRRASSNSRTTPSRSGCPPWRSAAPAGSAAW